MEPELVAGRGTTRELLDPLLIAITVLAGAVRFIGIGSQALWYDEVSTTHVIGGSLTGLLHRIRVLEGTPPLYFALATAWTRLFGSGDGALRSLSALVGTLTVPVVFLVIRSLGASRRAALFGALLASVNPFLVWYSQEARAYALVALLSTIGLLFFVRLYREPTRSAALLFGIANGLAIATHYFAAVLVAAELVVLAVRMRKEWKTLAIALAPIALVGALLLPLALRQSTAGLQDWISDWSLTYRARVLLRHFVVGPGAAGGWLWVVVGLVALVTIGLAVWLGTRAERRSALLMFGIGAATIVATLAVAAVGTDYFIDRNLGVALVPLLVAIAVGAAVKRLPWVGVACVAFIAATSLFAVVSVARQTDLQRANWRGVAAGIRRQTGTRVVVFNTSRVLTSAVLRYLPNAHEIPLDARVDASRVDFVGSEGVAPNCDWWSGRSCGIIFLVDRPPATAQKALTYVGTTKVDRFRISSYAPRSKVVHVGDLVSPSDRPGAMVLLVDGGAGP